MCDHLSRLRAISHDPWFVCGDFNEAIWKHEHLSSCTRSENKMLAFKDCFEVCELKDLGFSGYPYTYDNGQTGVRNVHARLDRAAADESWRDLFPSAKVLLLASPCSDHCPLLVQFEVVDNSHRQRTTPRYEIMLERHSALPEVIVEAWAKKYLLVTWGRLRIL